MPTSSPRKIIAPSLLSADLANLEKEINSVAEAGADWVHIDVMDGHFVNNITMGIPLVSAIKKVSPLPLDVHLMIENPEKYVAEFVSAGADFLTVHVEATKAPLKLLRKIRELGAKPGLSLRPSTNLSEIAPYLAELHLAMVMTVEPGFSGQIFMQEQVGKISQLKKLREQNSLDFLIEVDGGVNAKTASQCYDADVLVAGSFIFKNEHSRSIQILKYC